MKIIRNVIFILIFSIAIIGCQKKEKLVLECNTTIKESKERVQIKFYDSNTGVRTVKVIKEKETEQQIESLKQNYCNNQIKEDYSCEVEITENEIILTEKALSKVIMGETKEIGIKKYQKNLEMKGFKCQKDK